jgi:hypothetical protein
LEEKEMGTGTGRAGERGILNYIMKVGAVNKSFPIDV